MREHAAKQGIWARMLVDAQLPIAVPQWFLVVRAVTRSFLYGLLVLWIAMVPPVWPRRYYILGGLALCWIVLAVSLVIEFGHTRKQGDSWRPRISDTFLVLAPLVVLVGLPWVGIALMVIGYFIQLRRVSGGEIFSFAVFGVVMAMVLSTMALVDVESTMPGSQLAAPFEAAKYAVIQMFSLNGLHPHQPLSDSGMTISFFLQMIGIVLVASVAAGMLRALVGKQDTEHESLEDARMERILAQQEEILRRLDRLQGDSDAR